MTSELAAAVANARRTADSRSTIAAFTGVLLDAADGNVAVTGADEHGMFLTLTVAADVQEPGKTLIPGRILAEVTAKLAGDTTTVDTTDTGVTITSGRATIQLRTLPVIEFPRIPEPGDHVVHLDAAALVNGMKQVAAAKSSDDARPILTGVLLEATGNQVRFVATDSYRLAVRATPTETDLPGNVLVPPAAADWIAKLGDTSEVTLHLEENRLFVTTSNARMSTSLIEGDYPPWDRLLPDGSTTLVEVNAEDFAAAVKRMRLLSEVVGGPVLITVTPGKPVRITASSGGGDLATGTGTENLDATVTGEAVTIGFNPKYLAAGIDNVASDVIHLHINGPLKPALLRAPDANDGFTYLLMPVRVP